MKQKIATLALLLLPLLVVAQDHQYRIDTAAYVVDHYLRQLNHEALPPDSMLVMHTTAYVHGGNDTFDIKRWFVPPQMARVEVRHHGQLQTGLCSNGHDRFRSYNKSLGYWVDLRADLFYDRMMGYDFRGPLYNWSMHGVELSYDGKVKTESGVMMDAVRVNDPTQFIRVYLFEPSGLLSVVVSTGDSPDPEYKSNPARNTDWKVVHEYLRVGPCLLPKQESFLRNGVITVMETEAHLEARKDIIFNADRL